MLIMMRALVHAGAPARRCARMLAQGTKIYTMGKLSSYSAEFSTAQLNLSPLLLCKLLQ